MKDAKFTNFKAYYGTFESGSFELPSYLSGYQ